MSQINAGDKVIVYHFPDGDRNSGIIGTVEEVSVFQVPNSSNDLGGMHKYDQPRFKIKCEQHLVFDTAMRAHKMVPHNGWPEFIYPAMGVEAGHKSRIEIWKDNV